jgi:hypothetical protein
MNSKTVRVATTVASTITARKRAKLLVGTLLGHRRRSSLKSLPYLRQWFPASWDARRLARRLTRRVMACPTGVSQTPERLSALRPPLDGVSEAKRQSPDAAMRARERDGLFDIVRFANARAVAPVWSFPRKREPRITGRWSWIPTLRPLCGRRPGRRGGAKEQPVAVGNDVWVGLPVSGLFFTGNCATATCRAVSRPAGQCR